jgi:hypothetical protein
MYTAGIALTEAIREMVLNNTLPNHCPFPVPIPGTPGEVEFAFYIDERLIKTIKVRLGEQNVNELHNAMLIEVKKLRRLKGI